MNHKLFACQVTEGIDNPDFVLCGVMYDLLGVPVGVDRRVCDNCKGKSEEVKKDLALHTLVAEIRMRKLKGKQLELKHMLGKVKAVFPDVVKRALLEVARKHIVEEQELIDEIKRSGCDNLQVKEWSTPFAMR